MGLWGGERVAKVKSEDYECWRSGKFEIPGTANDFRLLYGDMDSRFVWPGMGVEHQNAFATGHVRQETGHLAEHDTERFQAALILIPAQVSTTPYGTVASLGIAGHHFGLALGCREGFYICQLSCDWYTARGRCVVAP